MSNEQPRNNFSVNNSNTTPPVDTSTLRLISAFVAGVVLSGLVIWGVVALRTTHGPSTPSSTTTTATTSQQQSGSALGSSLVLINNQGQAAVLLQGSLSVAAQPAGTKVVVGGIAVSTSTWIVVYDDTASKPGRVLGAIKAYPGESSVTVPLLRATVAGSTYLVGESTQNTGSHGYSSKTTQQLSVWTTFTAK